MLLFPIKICLSEIFTRATPGSSLVLKYFSFHFCDEAKVSNEIGADTKMAKEIHGCMASIVTAIFQQVYLPSHLAKSPEVVPVGQADQVTNRFSVTPAASQKSTQRTTCRAATGPRPTTTAVTNF